jgi:hypothetical protein
VDWNGAEGHKITYRPKQIGANSVPQIHDFSPNEKFGTTFNAIKTYQMAITIAMNHTM